MRADRLISVLMLLQTRGRLTASEVARELEISERTARRDLEALALAGVPVYSSVGRGGGWSLVGGARTDLTGLTDDESRALFLALGAAADAVRGAAAQAALRKLLAALPAPLRAGAQAAGAAIMVDPAGWGRTAPPEPPHLAALQSAVVGGRQVVLGYEGRGKPPSTRVVSPLGLVAKGPVWYLVAGTDAGVRTFRVGRVTAVTPTGAVVARPEGFDLARYWRDSAEQVEQRRTGAQVQAVADPAILPVLLAWLGRERVTVGAVDPAGRVAVEISGPTVPILVAQLAGLGRKLEITGPPEAWPQLAELADELRRIYG